MLFLYTGTDREKARAAMQKEIERVVKKEQASVMRITDAHAISDLTSALRGGGMFSKRRVLVFEGVCTNPELCEVFLDSLTMLSESGEHVCVFEERPLADVRRKLEKHTATVERFDVPKKAEDKSIFMLANALKRGDKKALWVGYLREIAKGSPPEMIHGIFFWAAKDMFLRAKAQSPAQRRGALLIAKLAELPHGSRRRGFDLEYALEHFVLSLS